MAYELDKRLVVGIASSALFDLAEADAVFREQGEEVYPELPESAPALPNTTNKPTS